MKIKKIIVSVIAVVFAVCLFAGCDSAFTNPGDYLGGGGTVSSTPSETDTDYTAEASSVVADIADDAAVTEVPEDAEEYTGQKITQSSTYYLTGEISGKIEITADDVTLCLSDATLTYSKKVIDSTGSVTMILIVDNYIYNTNADDAKNAVDVGGDLIIKGSGSLEIVSVKNGIKANSISIIGATVTIDAQNDGLHAEVDAYDDATEEPVPSYSDGGYVYLNGANVTVTSEDDGIQADTFVYITGDSVVNVLAGGGAPATVTTTSSDNASGKGIKAGQIDWGADGTDLEWEEYLVWIDSGEVTVNSNDDALHSNGKLLIEGGTISLSSGDDAIHSDDLLQITGGVITIDKCYEGIESAKVEISGGTIEVCSYEDGINAADGTQNAVNSANSNCHIIISGGYISVNCIGSEGDGVDSNGTILISGGQLYVAGSANSADAALDADGGILVDGGYVFAVGALGMVETPASNSAQCCVSFATSQSIASGTTLYLCDSDGNIIMYFTTPRSCQSVILSCPELQVGKTFSIYGGDTLLTSFTVSSTLTTIGSYSSAANPGGIPGGTQPGTSTPGFGRR